ncbi:DEAD/DEAH box helicase [Candidatus Paracaedibacter symbiosus]|uniref:DEAD/DEAH box helicase n=1 Tax=Candidatus Paracaedibacter symbiosus TaxID=244582 RepID=UPI0005098672|nr:DEAD/DEAH box helicase [Candidatus Paracaedibacter symbiosus]
MSFETTGLSKNLLKTIREIGYVFPTSIQQEAIPEILQGRDLLACAQTGTGKTASFALPIVDILQNTRKRNRLPRAIIMAPTRELAAQVEENIIQYAGGTGLSTVLLVGGEIVTSQERKLKKGVDIIIATPGRLIDMFERGRMVLIDIKIVVIDEADRMLDMGFMPDVDRILAMLPKLRQTLLFSATIAKEIQQISSQYQLNPKQITITRQAKTADTIDQHVIHVDTINKRKVMRKILSEHPSNEPTIVFCNRKRDVDIVMRSLVRHGYAAQAFHGDMSQHARNDALDSFKRGESRILVTSDVAARGIDVSGVTLVINFDMPVNNEDYVHRIGRTGRAGNTGKAITFVTKSEKAKLSRLEHLIKKTISPLMVEIAEEEKAPVVVKERSQRPERAERSSRIRTSNNRILKEEEFPSNSGPIIGFGDFIPAFMLIDPYSKMNATTA